MEQINMDESVRIETTEHSSKGNQLKWQKEGWWVKADHMGYEGLSETLVSRLLRYSDLSQEYVAYEPVRIQYHGSIYQGCRSRNFLQDGYELVTLEKLHRQYTGQSLVHKLVEFPEVRDRILYLVKQTEDFTGLHDFGPYLTAMLEIDALFMNEDRHTNNMAVLYQAQTDTYRLCPLFDHGLSLFSDTSNDYPLGLTLEECCRKIEAKPFSISFDDQLDAAEELYGVQQHFMLSPGHLQSEWKDLQEAYAPEILQRVDDLLRQQIRRYAYLMKRN